jgi:hypothetical protein
MGLFSNPKAPKKTAEQDATERRTQSLLNKEIEESEEKFKALARGKLGRQSLLSGAPRNVAEAASGSRSGGRGGAGSLLSGGGTDGSSGGGSSRTASRAPRTPVSTR